MKVIDLIVRTMFIVLGITAGFSYICFGVYILPPFIESLISTGASQFKISLVKFLLSLGVIGGGILISLIGFYFGGVYKDE